MLFSEAKGQKVVDLATAESAGKIDHFIVDPTTGKIVALSLKKTGKGAHTLHWSDIAAFGADAITIESADAIGTEHDEVAKLTDGDHELPGKRVLTTKGDELGKVGDVEFDPEDGTVTALVIGDERVGGSRLVGAGSYAVVVEATE